MKKNRTLSSVYVKHLVFAGVVLGGIIFFRPRFVMGQTGQEIIPTDVYYLASAIDNELVQQYGLISDPFDKKRISDNLRPRNVFQKALSVVEEFHVLHPGTIDQAALSMAHDIDAGSTRPQDVYNLLSTIKNALLLQDVSQQFPGQRKTKTPSDVYHMLRQISWHHVEIAKQLNITTNWEEVARVYDAVVINILPATQNMANEAGIAYDDYLFPPEPVSGVLPRNIYKLISHIYSNIARYYSHKGNYEPLVLLEITECDEISPADVFDLIQVVTAELKAGIGIPPLSSAATERYDAWKAERESIVPGHTFRLGQYTYQLTKRVMETQMQ